jgi:hypothetical protein
MKVLKPRSRMISIRLSEDEYQRLCRLSVESGAHSLSDLARNAMHSLLNLSTEKAPLSDAAAEVHDRMKILSHLIEELRDQLNASTRPTGQSSQFD